MRITILAILCVTAHASAQPAKARAAELFDQGRELAKLANFAEACDRFAKSYDLDPAAGTAVNFADCQEHLGHLARAWQLFDVASKDSELAANQVRAQYARDRASALLPRLATIVVKIADRRFAGMTVTIGDRDVPAAAELHERVDPGDVVVVVASPERRFTKTARAVAGASVEVDVPAPDAGATAATAETPARQRPWVVGAAIGAGGGIVGLVIGGVYGVSAIRHYNQAFTKGYCFSAQGGDQCTPAGLTIVSDAHSRADLSTAMVIGGALVVAGSAAAYLWAPRAPRHALEVRPAITPTSTGVTIGGSFW